MFRKYISQLFKKRSALILSFSFCFIMMVPVYPQPDSLLKYLEIAAKNNPVVKQRFYEYEAALKKVPQAGSLPDPQLDLGVFISPMELVGGQQVADLRLMQMFPWFGVLKNAKDEMSLMAKAKFELFRDASLQVHYDMKRTWYELFMVRKEISISEKNLEILKVIEQLALIKYKSPGSGNSASGYSQSVMQTQSGISAGSGTVSGMQGMGSEQTSQQVRQQGPGTASMQSGSMTSLSRGSGLTDIYRISIEKGDLENSIAYLRNREQSVMARFNGYLSRSPDVNVFTGDILLQDTIDLKMAAMSDSIKKRNPMLNMLDYEKESYKVRKQMVTGMGYPMIGLGLNYSFISRSEMSTSSMNGRDMIMPMVSVSLPIYRKKYNAMKEEADLLGKATEQYYQAESNSLQTEFYSAVQEYQDARRRVKLYQNQYSLSSKSLEILLRSFSNSSAELTDVLRVRQQTLEYELKQVEAITDLNTAIAWLDRLTASSNIE